MECEDNCNENHIKLGQHIDRVSLKFAENTVDLTSASEGFQREIERVQTIFRDLASEYMTTLEEKKQQNDTMLRGAGLNEYDLTQAKDKAKFDSKKALANLLPKIKQTKFDSNL